jgi:serine/threonine protein kinase
MAIEQTARTQLACKLVDLRRLRPSLRFGRRESILPADEVSSKDQARRLKQWADQTKRENKVEVKLKAYYSEAEILASIRHPNIIGLEKVFVTDNTIYMFQDLVTGGDLFSYLESKNGRLSEVEAAVILRQIVIALCFLHEKSIVHRDLKPDNILMTSLSTGCRVILTDFGAARRLQPRQRLLSVVGTEEYAAP